MLALFAGCVPPASFRQVKQPREGRALNARLCIVYSQRYQIDMGGLEKLHAFDINKYARIYAGLVADGLIAPADVFVPEPIRRDQLLLVHTPEYLARLRQPAMLARYLEFGPLALAPAGLSDAAILAPFRHATGGTLTAARLALECGMAINLAGGYHHAEPDRGGGFCTYADMPIAIRALQAEGRLRRVLVVDLDVHQGNGTALCVADDDDVFTFDMHEEGIYPIPKERNDLDVPLPAGTTDFEFLSILGEYLPTVLDRAKPELVIYQAGVDSLGDDPLATFRLTPEGIARRDHMVFAEAASRNTPIVMVLGGGYGPSAWKAQFQSIRGLIETYGTSARDHRPAMRSPTLGERIYVK